MIWKFIKRLFGFGKPEMTDVERVVLRSMQGRLQGGIYLWDLSGILPEYQDDELEEAVEMLESRGLITTTGDDIYDMFILPVFDE